eukprot:TRINITY_DN5437_c0_g1_i3.p1 TRINITY_DN5437_c0_g1~~TRINITY_DN5437_c0_g1_i3.p1  ORF type:complete len:400 (-),score=88.93 TRINITY_DN5437_c0_g1_i3:4-1203(-)
MCFLLCQSSFLSHYYVDNSVHLAGITTLTELEISKPKMPFATTELGCLMQLVQLKTLNINWLTAKCYSGDVCEELLHLALSDMPLTSLSMAYCQLSDDCIGAIAQALWSDSLTFLDLTGNNSVSDAAMATLPHYIPRVAELSFSNCITGPLTVQAVAKSCRSVRTFHAAWLPRLDNASMTLLASSCRELVNVDLNSSRKVGDAGIVALCTNCPRINHLNLRGLNTVSSEALQAVATLKSLVWFDGSLTRIDDTGVVALVQGCHAIETLILEQCNVSDVSLLAIGNNLPQLHVLDLQMDNKITDNGILAVGAGCRELRSAKLSYCASLNDRGVREFTRLSANLLELEISGVPDLQPSTLTLLSKRTFVSQRTVPLSVRLTRMEDFFLPTEQQKRHPASRK